MTAEPIPEGPWRTGRSWGRTIVIQSGPEPRKGAEPGGDTLIGYAKGPYAKENAQIACDAVNEGRRMPGGRWYALGCLVYDSAVSARQLVSDWIIAVDSPELAERIEAAVNGPGPDA